MNNYTILAVNNAPDILGLLAFILGEAGYRVLTAENGVEGLKTAQRELPDLIISDVMMPKMDGIEFCRKIRADKELHLIPFFLVSALRKDTGSIVEGLEAGADDFLEAPYEPMHLVAKVTQLIERKRTDDALRESENRFRMMIENVTDVISILAPDGKIIYESPSLENILGYKSEEILNQTAADFIHPEDVEKFIAYFNFAVNSFESANSIVYRCRHKDNSWRFIESLGKPFTDPNKGLVIIVASRDITERKQVESALQESKNQYRNFIEQSTEGIWRIEFREEISVEHPVDSLMELAGQHGYFAECNDAMARMYGFKSANDLIGKNLSDLMFLSESMNQEFIRAFIENDFRLTDAESHEIDAIGENKYFSNNLVGIIDDGKITCIWGTQRDITGQKTADTALRASEERFRTQYKGLPIPTTTWKRIGDDFVLVDFNDEAVEITKGKISDFLGITAGKIYVKNPEIIADFNRCFNEQSVISRETPFKFITTGEEKRLIITCVFVSPDILMVHYRDITAQTHAEEKIKASEARLANAQRIANIGNWDWDIQANRLHWSDEVYRILGLVKDESEISYEFFINGIHPKDRQMVQEALDSSVSQGNSYNIEYRVVLPNDEERFVQGIGEMIFDKSGKALRMTGTVQDISERKQAEEALSRSENHLRAMVDTQPECVKLLGLKGELLEINPAGLAMIEADSLEQVKGADIAEIVAPEYRMAFSDLRNRVLKGESGMLAFEIIGLKGTHRWLETHAVPLRNQSGEIISLLAVTSDVTRRKKAENDLAEANERAIREYDRLLQRLSMLAQKSGSARDLATIFSAILDFALCSVPCSGLLVSLYDEEKMVRKFIYIWYNGNEMDASTVGPVSVGEGAAGQAIKSGEVTINNDYLKVCGNKSTNLYIGFDEDERKPRSTIIAPMKMMGKVIGAIEVQSYELGAYLEEHATAMRMAANVAANAIENVRLLEQERQNAERLKLSQKLESVGRLAGGIAHDFNNMLTAINGYSDLTLRRLDAESPLRKNIEEIKKAGERSAALTHQLLAFSRRQVLKPKILNLNEVVIDTNKMLQRLIGEDIQFNIVPNPKLGLIEADPGQLTQVIMNLVINARDAMPQGGSLTIETDNVYLDKEYSEKHIPTRTGSYILLAVSDTGVGISAETQQHIFEPFFTTKETGKGTGLGLATVYGIVKQSGGYIWVYSEVGKGTTFKIYLPRVDEKVEFFEENKESAIVISGTETILLVEDEEMVRNLSRQVLETCGYKVIEARNGIEALSICDSQNLKIDLLMTDVVMPQMGGRELAEKLIRIYPHVRLLYTSGYTDDAIIRQGMITENMNFIQKPFTFEGLAKKIRDLLDTKKG